MRVSIVRASRCVTRLDRDTPDLAALVRAKELSANAAALEAGAIGHTIGWPTRAGDATP